MAIWGNHSATQFPDFAHARIGGKPVPEVITDHEWLRGPFIETVQKRGADGDREARRVVGGVGRARRDRLGEQRRHADARRRLALARGREQRRVRRCPRACSSAIPVRSDGDDWAVVEGLEHDEFAQEKIRVTTEELVAERDEVKDLLPGVKALVAPGVADRAADRARLRPWGAAHPVRHGSLRGR